MAGWTDIFDDVDGPPVRGEVAEFERVREHFGQMEDDGRTIVTEFARFRDDGQASGSLEGDAGDAFARFVEDVGDSLDDLPRVAGEAHDVFAEHARELDGLVEAGLVVPARGVLTGWALTPAGRTEHLTLLAAQLDGAGCREKVEAAYRRFAVLNRPFLDVCTDWQLRDGVRNDHTDRAHDVSVVVRLLVLHHDLQPVLDDLEACLDRFARYRPCLDAACAHIEAGEYDWFTKPMIDSYHTVWFQLHEDLLTTLGLERAKEGT